MSSAPSILLLFFLSGASSLIYQVVWVRMLVLVFGMSVFAVSTVLAAFMGGLALGSWWFGRLVDRRGNGLRIYAWLEAGIGLFALVFPFILVHLDGLYTVLYRGLGGNDYVFALVRFLLCFLVLLVPTTLMGGTLPVLGKFFVRRPAGVGKFIGGLYAVNTLGASAGCFVAAYVLMEHLGTRGTTYIAAATNLSIAAVAFLLSRKSAAETPRSAEAGERPVEPVEPIDARRVARLVFWGFALSGFVALGYEVVWTRLLTMVLNITTIQSVSTILIAFLAGLALGGAVGARFVDRWAALPAIFGSIELLLGLFGLCSVAVFGAIPLALRYLGALPSWWGHVLKLFVVAFSVMLVPTFLMGLLFPVAGKIYVRGLRSLGTRIGAVYAANTAGAIAGAFVTGFVLIPALGTQHSVHLLAWINIGIGTVALLLARRPRGVTRLLLFGLLATPALLLTLLLPSRLLVRVFESSQPGTVLLYHDEDTGGTVTVHGYPDGKRLLKVNGAGEVPTDRASLRTFRLLGSLPLVLHPSPEQVLVIAFGGGITLSTVELFEPACIDCVEVVPGVFRASRYFARFNGRIFERLQGGAIDVVVDDGRNHVLRTERRYDVIISDATHPGTADSWILYTEEFYRLCKSRLDDGGIMAQWLPLHGLSSADHKMILRTFRTVFPHATLWLTRGYSVLLATPERLSIEFDGLARRLNHESIRSNLFEVDLDDPFSYLAALALDEEAALAYTGPGSTNTDDRPHISFTDRSTAGTAGGLPVALVLIPALVEDPRSIVTGADTETLAKLRRRFVARKLALSADVRLRLGDREGAVRELRRARAVDPDERTAPRMLRNLGE